MPASAGSRTANPFRQRLFDRLPVAPLPEQFSAVPTAPHRFSVRDVFGHLPSLPNQRAVAVGTTGGFGEREVEPAIFDLSQLVFYVERFDEDCVLSTPCEFHVPRE